MERRPLFTVIVPTYGRSPLLREALDSVQRQTVSDFECLVVDDGAPSPASVPVDGRIKLIRRDANGGAAAARNTGLAAAHGRFVTFLDDDDIYESRRLEIALRGLESADIAVCHRGSLLGSSRSHEALQGRVHDVIADTFCPHLGQTAVRREVCPPLDERFFGCEDVEWWIRASKTLRVATVPEIGYRVRSHHGPRHLNGQAARITGSKLLLDAHPEYFASHPRAKAFRWLRIGLLLHSLGDRAAATSAFTASMTTRPSLQGARWLSASLLRRPPAAQPGART